MHVAISINKLDDVTGTETYCLDLVDELTVAGHTSSVFTLSSTPEMEARLRAAGGVLFAYPDYPTQPADRVIVMHPLATTLLLRTIDPAVPTLALIHSPWEDEYPVRMHRIDRFIAVSDYVADELRRKHGVRSEHLGVIPNGVDTHRFQAERVRARRPAEILWGSVYHPDRHGALVAVLETVLARDDLKLTIVDAELPQGLIPSHDRIQVVPKQPDSRPLLAAADVVCALGPGRILIEALAMNKAALCLNTHRRGEYLDAKNRIRLEYYFSQWGAAVGDLLTPDEIFRNSNRRDVATRYFDKRINLGRLVSELEGLGKRHDSPRGYRLADVKRTPYLAREYGVLLEAQAARNHGGERRAASYALSAFRLARRLLPHRVRRALHRLAD